MNGLVPANELPNAFLDPDRGPVPELALGAAQVRRGESYVARLVAVALDPHLAPQRPSDQLDQSVEPHTRPAADIDRLGEPPPRPRPAGPFHGGQDAVHAIRNIGIVALARPVPVHPDRLSGADQMGKPMDREVGPLARPVHREEPKAGDLQPVEVRERVRHQLPGALAGGVGRNRPDGRRVLGEGGGRGVAVYRRRRAEHDPPEAGAARRLEHAHRSGHVGVAVGSGVLERRAHPRAGREVQHDRYALERERIADDIGLHEAEALGPAQPVEVPLLHGAGVEGIEVVDAHDLVTPGEERFAHVRADEPGRARDEQPGAHASVSPLKYSMVRRSPSSSDTFGSQPSVSRARWMSGWRTFGSSVGRGRSTMRLRLPVSRSTSSANWRTVNSWGLPMFVGSGPPRSNSLTIPSTRSST